MTRPPPEDDRPLRPRLLQVITDTRRRGAQVFAVDLDRALEQRGWDTRTVALAHESGDLDVPVLGPTRTATRTLRRLRREIRRAGVVVGHGSTTLPMCALAGLGTGVPFVYRQISDSLYWAPTAARRLRVRAGLHRTRAVVALWEGSARVLREHFGVAAAKLHVVPNGVPADGYQPADTATREVSRRRFDLPADVPVVAYVGALVPEKGVDGVVRAVSHVPAGRLLVVGDGPERDRLEALAGGLLGGRARFTGWVDSAADVLAAADVLVLFSRSESMPAVLIEAGFCAVPSVATAVGAIPEIVADGQTGVLVPVGDEAALRDAVGALLSDPDGLAAMGAAARRRCLARYEIRVVAASWERVLSAVANPGGDA